MTEIRIGCSGWNYDHWRNGVFYPPRLAARDWLRFYAERFDTVEVNATFYRLPREAMVERWVEAVPPTFTFAVKVSRYVTHVLRLRDAGEHLDLLLERLGPLARSPQLGPLLWQLPPTFARDDARLADALAALPRRLRHAIEFRHPSWFDDDVYALLREHGVALVVGDRAETRRTHPVELTADFAYVRFHHGGAEDGNYSHRELATWARRLREWSEQVDVYAYFNNDWEGYAVENATALKHAVA